MRAPFKNMREIWDERAAQMAAMRASGARWIDIAEHFNMGVPGAKSALKRWQERQQEAAE